MIEKAFVINTARTELLATLAKTSEATYPVHPLLAHLPPSLFQAFYEKSVGAVCIPNSDPGIYKDFLPYLDPDRRR